MNQKKIIKKIKVSKKQLKNEFGHLEIDIQHFEIEHEASLLIL